MRTPPSINLFLPQMGAPPGTFPIVIQNNRPIRPPNPNTKPLILGGPPISPNYHYDY